MIRLIRPFPRFDFVFIKPLRSKAVKLLQLCEGDRALDLGCGPGGCFPYLRESVGATGEVTGVEISREVAINAERRVRAHGWQNVNVVVGAAESVQLPGTFDGALMFGAPDVYASIPGLENVVAHLRPSSRVVLFGAKTSTRRTGWLLNGFFRHVFKRLSFQTTPVPDDAPWSRVAPYLDSLVVEEHFGGWMFLASGTIRTGDDSTALPETRT